VLNILDKIERMLKKEEWERMDEDERMIEMLRDVVERTSKLKVANDLKINRKTLERALSGSKNYPHYLYLEIKRYLSKNS
jgi:DNA-binding phage protein